MADINNQYFHENYETFERDELHFISLIKIYHGMLNYFWFKAIGASICLVLMWVGIVLTFRGKKDDYVFQKEDREKVLYWNSIVVKAYYMVMGGRIYEKDLTNDEKTINIFRKYLGKDYIPEEKYCSVAANHISWMDILYTEKRFSPSFIAKDSVKSIPLIGKIAWGHKAAFIARKDKDAIEKTKQWISNKQNDVNENRDFFPLGIYPEGTTSNGRYISSFKTGTFYNLHPIKSCLFDVNPYKKTSFSVCAAAMDIALHIALTFTFLYVEIDAYVLPTFKPNEYLYENFKHLGKEKHHIYAQALRQVWSEFLKFPISNSTLDTKIAYKSRIKGKIIKEN